MISFKITYLPAQCEYDVPFTECGEHKIFSRKHRKYKVPHLLYDGNWKLRVLASYRSGEWKKKKSHDNMYGTTVDRVDDINPKFIIFIIVKTNNHVQPTATNNTEHQLQTSTKTITLSSCFLFFDLSASGDKGWHHWCHRGEFLSLSI